VQQKDQALFPLSSATTMGKRKNRADVLEEHTTEQNLPEQPAKVARTDVWRNKEKVLLLSSRGITYRFGGEVPLYPIVA
jgi:hypothetical protein